MSTAESDRLRLQERQASIMRSVLESIDALTEGGSPQVQAIYDVLNLKQLSILLLREMEHTVSTIRPSRYDRIASTLGAYNAICIEKASRLGDPYASTFETVDALLEKISHDELSKLPKKKNQILAGSSSYCDTMNETLVQFGAILAEQNVVKNAGPSVADIVVYSRIR